MGMGEALQFPSISRQKRCVQDVLVIIFIDDVSYEAILGPDVRPIKLMVSKWVVPDHGWHMTQGGA